jgi:S1-C subfamily serine protease
MAAGLLSGSSSAPAAVGSSTTGVVVIQTRLGPTDSTAAGTGMVLTPSGEVLTNNHVIRGATRIRVRVPATGRTYSARVLGYSVAADVALLKLTGASALVTVSVGNSSKVELGDDVTAVGNAGGTGRLTTKEGAITGIGREITVNDGQGNEARLTHLLETDAGVAPGDSGGAVLDTAGRVIGMTAAASFELGSRSTSSDGYAIPINRVVSIARQIERGSSSASVHIGATPFLGISADTRPLTEDRGVLVAGVQAGSPAARAGLAAGDAIVAFNGNAVPTYSKLVARMLRWHPGDTVRLTWIDEFGTRDAATVKLTSGPPQ